MSLYEMFIENARVARSKARYYRELAMAEPNPTFRRDHLVDAAKADDRADFYELQAYSNAKPAIERAA